MKTRTRTAKKTLTETITEAHVAKVNVPIGYVVLQGDRIRKIRVNKRWIGGYGNQKQFIVFDGVKEEYYEDVIINGKSRMVASEEAVGCSVSRSAYVECECELFVKE